MLAFSDRCRASISRYYQHQVERAVARRNDPNREMPKFAPSGKRTESVLEVNRQYRPDLQQDEVDKLMKVYEDVRREVRNGEPW